jgi:hypothetical protein
MGFMVDKMALGQIFSKYFGFPCQSSFHQMFHIHLSPGIGAVGQLVADLPIGLSLTAHNEIKKKWPQRLRIFGRWPVQISVDIPSIVTGFT